MAGLIGMVLGFSFIIFIHELGHFVMAKWNGVKVHVFSIGMGPYLFSFSRGGTLYVLSALPIGGYVQMLGQEDLNADPKASTDPGDYRRKRPGQKAAILAGGALFNVLFALAAFTTCYYVGIDLQPPRLGYIFPDRPVGSAVKHPDRSPANLQPGDRVLSVNGMHVKSFMELVLFASGTPTGEEIALKVEHSPDHDGPVHDVYVKPVLEKRLGANSIGLLPYEAVKSVPLGFATRNFICVGPFKPEKDYENSPARKAGLKEYDEIAAIEWTNAQGQKESLNIDSLYPLQRAIRGAKDHPVTFTLLRGGQPVKLDIKPEYNEKLDALAAGVPLQLRQQVSAIEESSAAYAAGLRTGCFVYGFEPDDPKARHWSSGTLLWSKEWAVRDEQITRTRLENIPHDSVNMYRQIYMPTILYQEPSLGAALGTAWNDVFRLSGTVFTTLRGLVAGAVRLDALSGALGIGQILHKVASRDNFINFLWMLGFISLNVGILQFIPIPILDGFHLLLVAIEKIKGSPVSARIQAICMWIGIAVVGSLLLLTSFNDLRRIVGF